MSANVSNSQQQAHQQVQPHFSATQKIVVPEGVRVAARVKWFDNKMNYGFATVLSGEHTGKDIFVHQSNILTIGQNVYRTLCMGEYIELELEETQGNEHRYQAVHVTGPHACPLMCETNPQRHRHNFETGHKRGATYVAQGYGSGGFVTRGRGRGSGRRLVENSN